MKIMKLRLPAVLLACVFALSSCGGGEETPNPGPGDGEEVKVQSVTLDKSSETLEVGETLTLVPTVLPSDATDKTVIWTSSNPAVADVDSGKVTAIADGECTITVTTSDGWKKAECAITVMPGIVSVTGVTVKPATASIAEGKSLRLIAEVKPSNATDASLKWTSGDSAIVSVDNEGIITGVAHGNTTVTVTTVDGKFKAECKVDVAPPPVTHPFFGEINFRSGNTRVVGQQMWSDVVVASLCKKNDFYGGYWNGTDDFEYTADCRQSPGYGDLFSWGAVDQYMDDLCPGDWRVPTMEDFIALDLALGGSGERDQENHILYDKYINTWGAELGGHALNGQLNHPGSFGNYWSQSTFSSEQYGDSKAHALVVDGLDVSFGGSGWVHVFPEFLKFHGFNVRCVK